MAAPRRRMVMKWISRRLTRQLGVIDDLAIEVEPLGVGAGHFMPELHEAHQLAVLIVAGQVGVGVTQATAVLFEREERQDARPGLASEGEVMAVERRRVAPEGDRMEVERESLGLWEEDRGQGLDPALQQAALLITNGPVGVGGGERLLGGNVEAGEEADHLVAVEVVDMAPSLLVEQFQGQEREQGACGRDHPRAGIPGLGDEPIEAEPGQEGQEEEGARDAGADGAAGLEVQLATVGDVGRLGARSCSARTRAEGPPAAVREKKGVATPRRRSDRRRLAIDLSVAGMYPYRSATRLRGSSSTKMARSASYWRWNVWRGSRKNPLMWPPSMMRAPCR